MSAVIELDNVMFATMGIEIIKGLSYEFETGKTTALVGPSGGGKSTVLKLAAGLLVPSYGYVRYFGQDIFAMNRAQTLSFRKDSAVVFQDSALWANQNLFQILELPLRMHYSDMTSAEREQRMTSVIKLVGYKRQLDLRPSQLSMGEQKLIGFARALLCNPSLLFLDEWTESLDDVSSLRLINLVKERQKQNDTIIFVSHNFKAIKQLADRILLIIDGKLSSEFTSAQIEADEDLEHLIEERIAV